MSGGMRSKRRWVDMIVDIAQDCVATPDYPVHRLIFLQSVHGVDAMPRFLQVTVQNVPAGLSKVATLRRYVSYLVEALRRKRNGVVLRQN